LYRMNKRLSRYAPVLSVEAMCLLIVSVIGAALNLADQINQLTWWRK